MYKSKNTITNGLWDLSNYINDIDIYNSVLLNKLSNPGLTREPYEIKTFLYRPDLIAKDYYESENYMGLIMLQTGLTLPNFVRGTILNLIVKKDLDRILSEL